VKKAAYHLGEAAFISENENNIDYKKAKKFYNILQQ
jgi:hypothetical protein